MERRREGKEGKEVWMRNEEKKIKNRQKRKQE